MSSSSCRSKPDHYWPPIWRTHGNLVKSRHKNKYSICFHDMFLWCPWQEAKKGMAVAGKINVTPLEEKPLEDEPLVYASKLVLTYIFTSY
jgi:hypothetical protein